MQSRKPTSLRRHLPLAATSFERRDGKARAEGKWIKAAGVGGGRFGGFATVAAAVVVVVVAVVWGWESGVTMMLIPCNLKLRRTEQG